MIVKKKGKFYVVSREAVRKLVGVYAEKIGREIAESEIRHPQLVIDANSSSRAEVEHNGKDLV